MKLKSIALTLLAAAMCGLSVSAAKITPSKNHITKKMKAGNFTAVRTDTSIDIVFSQGPQEIEIYAPDNLMPYVKVIIKNGELQVSYSENMQISGKNTTELRVSSPNVTSFTTGSAGDIRIISDLTHKDKEIKLQVLSAGDITAKNISGKIVKFQSNSAGDISANSILACETIRLIANSAGDITAKEAVAGTSVEMRANSAGDIDIDKVSAVNVSISANSAGDVEVKNLEANDVQAHANSAGDIELSGICENASYSCTSSGCIDADNLKATNVSARTSSTGSIGCHALNAINATRGIGNIEWKGNPSNVQKTGFKN